MKNTQVYEPVTSVSHNTSSFGRLTEPEWKRRNWFELLKLSSADEHFFRIGVSDVFYDDLSSLSLMNRFPKKKVIVDLTKNMGISMVRSGFCPVSHDQAFALGVEIYQQLFGVHPMIHRQKTNQKRTDYSVDLVSEECRIIIDRNGYKVYHPKLGKQEFDLTYDRDMPMPNRAYVRPSFSDEYFPFLRVTNYLRDGKSFEIELGYYRSRCSNGMLLGSETKMRFQHSYFVHSFAQIKTAALKYFLHRQKSYWKMAEQLWRLLEIYVPQDKMKWVALDIFKETFFNRERESQSELLVSLDELVERYVEEIGENMNAAINVATDFSKLLYGSHVSPSKVEQMSSDWMEWYLQDDKGLERYSERMAELESRIKGLHGFESFE